MNFFSRCFIIFQMDVIKFNRKQRSCRMRKICFNNFTANYAAALWQPDKV